MNNNNSLFSSPLVSKSLIDTVQKTVKDSSGEKCADISEGLFAKKSYAFEVFNRNHGTRFKASGVEREAKKMSPDQLRKAADHHMAQAKHKRSINQYNDAGDHREAASIYKSYIKEGKKSTSLIRGPKKRKPYQPLGGIRPDPKTIKEPKDT